MKKLKIIFTLVLTLLILVSCAGTKKTVKFNLNGGSGNFSDVSVIKGGVISKPKEEPVKSGFTFIGWYLDDEEFDFATTRIYEDIELVAKWEEVITDLPEPSDSTATIVPPTLGTSETIVTVSFNSNGGSPISNQTIESGKTVLEPNEPIRDGYIFTGWHLDEQLEIVFDFTMPVTENITLYASWTIVGGALEVTFVLNNDSGDIVLAVNALDKINEPEGITNGDLFLSGWFSDEYYEGDEWDFENDVVTKDLILYARWSEVFTDVTVQNGVNGNFDDSQLANNAEKLTLEPSYFNVKAVKGLNTIPGVYNQEIRIYPGGTVSFEIHESFVISNITFVFGDNHQAKDRGTTGENLITLGRDQVNIGHSLNETKIFNNLNINYFEIKNISSVTAERTYISSIEITYYQIGPDVVKEDDINRPFIDISEHQLIELEVGDTISVETLEFVATDVEDIFVDVIYESNNINIHKYGVYYAFYYAIDSDGYRTDAYITIIVREQNQIEDYYQNVNLAGNGVVLFEELRDLLEDTLSFVNYQTGNSSMEISDRDPYNFNNVWLIYNSQSITGKWNATNWTKEHVWAKSSFGLDYNDLDRTISGGKELGLDKKFDNDYRGIGSDLHNLRAINQTVNVDHSNHAFRNPNGGEGYPFGSMTIGSTKYFYPGDDHKGDVARILLYMNVLYGLVPREDFSMLVDWHLDDEVDNFEIIRNEVIFTYQGNRNPFIDYPKLVNDIFVQ